MDVYQYPHGDSILIDKIVNEFLSQGKFDKLRKECMSDADTKPAYQNLQQRVENTVTQFLKKQIWRPDLNKNQLRDSLRKHILDSKFFDAGINRIVDQVVNPNVLGTVFLPEVEEVVYNYLSIPRPSDKTQRRGPPEDKIKSSRRDYGFMASYEPDRHEKYLDRRERSFGSGDYRRENHFGEEYRPKDVIRRKSPKNEIPNEPIRPELLDEKGKTECKIKSEPEEENRGLTPVDKMETVSDESQESLSRLADEGLHINEPEGPSVPDSDDSVPLEINEKSMSESRDSEDSIMNQMSPISQGRLTPDLEEELPEVKPEIKPEIKEIEKLEVKEEKNPLTFIGRIPKIKREDTDSLKSSKSKDDSAKKDKLDVKHIYSSDESDSSKSFGKSDSDEKKRKSDKSNKDERKRESEKRQNEKKDSSKDRKRERSRDRDKDHKRERSRERHKKSSSSSSSSQRERSSSHHKSSHRHKDSKSKRKEEEKKKSKSTDDHSKERNKKEDRRSTDRDSNERERGRSSGSKGEGESKKIEKEEQKSEESREERNQKEEAAEVEKESEVVIEMEEMQSKPVHEIIILETKTAESIVNDDIGSSLDFSELFQYGALSKVEFPKLTDDFYVKFNSTGFKYFEEWEKAKLDCEEEFKEFVDEAENNMTLLSDDESDLELENGFAEENKITIRNLLKGLGNFRQSLMFDPATSEFYKWTNNVFYQKFRKKEEKRERGTGKKNVSNESIKENIDQGEKTRALHLKLLKKYKRKAMRLGKPRRRQKRLDFGGIKEKNENRHVSKFFNGASKMTNRDIVGTQNSPVPENVNSISGLYGSETVTLPESPEENEDWSDAKKNCKENKTAGSGTNLSQNLPLNLPPSPDSDDVNTSNDIGSKKFSAVPHKRFNREREDGVTPKKQRRSHSNQKYDSQDLYKPRPALNGSRTRGREKGLDRDIVSLDSPIPR